MMDSRKIFDTALLAKRRAAALANTDYPDFLDALIAREFVARLELIERHFETCMILGPASPTMVATLKQSPKLNKLFTQGAVADTSADIIFSNEWLPLRNDNIDCLIAAAGFELVNDLPGTLIQINRALKPDGLFLAAMFAGNTLAELRHAWLLADEEITGGATPRISPFADVRQSGNLLQRAGFALPVSDMDSLTIRYDNAIRLMQEIRQMGFANPLSQRSKKPTGRRVVERVNEHYANLFSDADGRVRATLEINYLTAWAPHESQQKPLQPGSGKTSLADILDVNKTKA